MMKRRIRRAVEKAMFKLVVAENRREMNGEATRERVEAAMEFVMEPGQTFQNEIAVVLTQMLGNAAKYDSKTAMWDEAMARLYAQEPEDTDSDSTIEVDLDSSD